MRWPLFDVIDEGEARAVLAAARRRRFARGEVLFHEGDPADSMHLIDKGKVAIRVTTPLGDVATLRILGPGDHVGELAVVSPAPRNATVVALEATETMVLHKSAVDDLREAHPSIDRILLEAAIKEVRRLSVALLDALYVPLAKRVPGRILDLAAIYDDGAGGPILIRITQEDLAGLCGTTRPTTNQILMSLQERRLIELGRGRIHVLDVEGLRRLSR